MGSKGSNLTLANGSDDIPDDPDYATETRPVPKDFRNNTWNELQHNETKRLVDERLCRVIRCVLILCIYSSELSAPRVRNGPRSSDPEYIYPPHSVFKPDKKLNYFGRRAQAQNFKKQWEDWENCTEVNLAFQELGDAYQKKNLKKW